MKMNLTQHIVVTAVVLLLASSGIVHPVIGSASELSDEIAAIEAEQASGANVHEEFVALLHQTAELEERMAHRSDVLCPDTPEALQQFQTALMSAVQEVGMRSIRTYRHAGNRSGPFPYVTHELSVLGDAQSLLDFLVRVESMAWVTRVRSLTVDPAQPSDDAQRRITMQIAVILET